MELMESADPVLAVRRRPAGDFSAALEMTGAALEVTGDFSTELEMTEGPAVAGDFSATLEMTGAALEMTGAGAGLSFRPSGASGGISAAGFLTR